jgi:hypothetical protein
LAPVLRGCPPRRHLQVVEHLSRDSEVGRSFALAIISNGLICAGATTRGAGATTHAPTPITIRAAAAVKPYAVTPESPLTKRSINARMNRSFLSLFSKTCKFESILPAILGYSA